jgi:hypothetical protein
MPTTTETRDAAITTIEKASVMLTTTAIGGRDERERPDQGPTLLGQLAIAKALLYVGDLIDKTAETVSDLDTGFRQRDRGQTS